MKDSGMNYVQLWRRVPAALGFIVPGFFLSLAAFSVAMALFTVGLALAIMYVGLVILSLGLVFARSYGKQELARLQAAGEPRIEPPVAIEAGTPWWRGFSTVKSPSNWRAFLYIVVAFVLYIFTFCVLLPFSLLPLALPYWILVGRWLPGSESLGDLLAPFWGMPSGWISLVLYTAISVISALVLPYVSAGFLRAHWHLAHLLLGRRAHEQLRQQLSDMGSAEGRTLRSLERDIHDGPQQQLLRLQMDLSAARRRLDDDPDGAKEMLIEAQNRSADTLAELRRLSKGIAPPLLQDRGLLAAVESLAERNLIPTTVESVGEIVVPPQLDHNAYFVVSELFANATKHSQASSITATLRVSDGFLMISVADNGRGGARLIGGGGLAGLEERVRGLGGSAHIESPRGGPTQVTTIIPL